MTEEGTFHLASSVGSLAAGKSPTYWLIKKAAGMCFQHANCPTRRPGHLTAAELGADLCVSHLLQLFQAHLFQLCKADGYVVHIRFLY